MTTLVITPTLGRSEFLQESVASVRACGGGVRHLMVCPLSEVARLAATFPDVEVIGDAGRGVYAAINRGLEVVGSWDAWTWLNDDDRWQPEGFRRALALMEREPAVAVAYGRVGFVDAGGSFLCEVPVESSPHRLEPLLSAGVAAITQQGTLVRRSCAEKLGNLRTEYRLVADVDYWIRAVLSGNRFSFVDERVADFRIRPGQLSEDTGIVREELRKILRLYFPAGPGLRGRSAAAWFRIRRWPEIVERYRRTGCWRTRTLFHRAATAGSKPR